MAKYSVIAISVAVCANL